MAKKTHYQKFVIKCLFQMFKTTPRTILNQPGIRKKIIDSMVRHYPEITNAGSLTYTNIGLYRRHFKWSERAVHTCSGSAASVHTEHIVPVNDCMLRLYALPSNFTIRDLMRVFDEYQIVSVNAASFSSYKVDGVIVRRRFNGDLIIDNRLEQIIISHEEKDVLDGNIHNLYPLTDPFPPFAIKMVNGTGLKSIGTKIDRIRGGNIYYDLTTVKNCL